MGVERLGLRNLGSPSGDVLVTTLLFVLRVSMRTCLRAEETKRTLNPKPKSSTRKLKEHNPKS